MDAHYNNETSNWQRFHSKLHFQLSSAFLRYFHEICNITPCIIVLRDQLKIHLILRVFFHLYALYARCRKKNVIHWTLERLEISRWNIFRENDIRFLDYFVLFFLLLLLLSSRLYLSNLARFQFKFLFHSKNICLIICELRLSFYVFFCQWWRMEIPITMATMMMERYWFRSSCSLSLCLFFRLEQNRFYPDRNQKLVSVDDESTIRYVFAAR